VIINKDLETSTTDTLISSSSNLSWTDTWTISLARWVYQGLSSMSYVQVYQTPKRPTLTVGKGAAVKGLVAGNFTVLRADGTLVNGLSDREVG